MSVFCFNILAILYFAFMVQARASPLMPVKVDQHFEQVSLGETYLQLYFNSSKKLSFEGAQELFKSGHFLDQNRKVWNSGFKKGELWVTAKIRNTTDKVKVLFLRSESLTNRRLYLYLVDEQGHVERKAHGSEVARIDDL